MTFKWSAGWFARIPRPARSRIRAPCAPERHLHAAADLDLPGQVGRNEVIELLAEGEFQGSRERSREETKAKAIKMSNGECRMSNV